MPVRYIPEGESRFLTKEALAFAYRICADETLPREIVETTLTEAVRLSLAGGFAVSGDLFEALLWSVCDMKGHLCPGTKDFPLC
ncbi:MAG: hypothetical protein Q7I97_03485 [Thermovirgaceae bacterium]|nr:hypothetical protein [Thermovirgaceae bacterium]